MPYGTPPTNASTNPLPPSPGRRPRSPEKSPNDQETEQLTTGPNETRSESHNQTRNEARTQPRRDTTSSYRFTGSPAAGLAHRLVNILLGVTRPAAMSASPSLIADMSPRPCERRKANWRSTSTGGGNFQLLAQQDPRRSAPACGVRADGIFVRSEDACVGDRYTSGSSRWPF